MPPDNVEFEPRIPDHIYDPSPIFDVVLPREESEHSLFNIINVQKIIKSENIFSDEYKENLILPLIRYPNENNNHIDRELPRREEPDIGRIAINGAILGLTQLTLPPLRPDRLFADDYHVPFVPTKPTEEELSDPIWLVEHAEHVPKGWNKPALGRIIKNRIRQGIDANVHDASYWLVEFDYPQEVDGEPLKSLLYERILLLSVLLGKSPERLPTNEQRIRKLFHDDETAELYLAIIGSKDEAGELDKVSALQTIEALGTNTAVDFAQKAKEAIEYGFELSPSRQVEITEELKKIAMRREAYIHDAQNWLKSHSNTPRDLLVFAWKNRDLALKDGAEDNPTAIKAWASENSLRLTLQDMLNRGTAPNYIEMEDLEIYGAYIKEMSRVYETRQIIRTIAKHKEIFNPESYFPAHKLEFDDGYSAEILPRDDPRGYTIGEDTGCCMTPSGQARTCLEAGYGDSRYSFFALYDSNGKLVAQSLLFVDSEQDSEVIVIDNIEATEGRDRGSIRDRYESFFRDYLNTFESINGNEVKRVQLGIHYSDGYSKKMQAANPVLTPKSGTYTDARTQRTLIDLELESEVFDFIPTTANDTGLISELEAQIYIDNGLESFEPNQVDSVRHSDVFSGLINAPGSTETVGYTIAYMDKASNYSGVADEDEDEDEDVIYIDDVAIKPEHQRGGYGWAVLERYTKLASRLDVDIMLHAKDSTSWKVFENREEELEALGYKFEVIEYDPKYFDNEGAHLLRLSSIDTNEDI